MGEWRVLAIPPERLSVENFIKKAVQFGLISQHTLNVFNLLCLHLSLLGDDSPNRGFLSFRVHIFTGQLPSHNWNIHGHIFSSMTPSRVWPPLPAAGYRRVSSANNCICLIWILLTTAYSTGCSSKSKWKLIYDRRSFGLSVLVSAPVDQRLERLTA
jgi:hypothetical protein